MSFNYEKNLAHQEKAVDAVLRVFENELFERGESYSNPKLIITNGIINNIRNIQKDNDINEGVVRTENPFIIDVKMETGTGKTYTYVKTIFSLNQRYGINKFIIVVPTLPIKAGTEKFLKSDGMKYHFKESDMFPAKEIRTYVVESVKSKKGKRDYIPQAISDFVSADINDKRNIHVLLINSGMINSKTLEKQFDSNLIDNFSKPFEAIASTNPFVIIDEPHKFALVKKTFQNLLKFSPQCIIRYGATYPIVNKKIEYNNLLYNLTALEAFNNDLVKGINVHIPSFDQVDEKIKLMKITNGIATFKHIKDKEVTFELEKGDSLSIINKSMIGITIEHINKTNVTLSNGIELGKGNSINPHSYDQSLQEIMIKKAIDSHFEKEIEYFQKEVKIKPITLFFIDYVDSYRSSESSDNEFVRIIFERLLQEKITEIIEDTIISEEYKNYLRMSLDNVAETHGGYFAKDNTDKEEKVIAEIEEILSDKERLLSYKVGGQWNLRRFIFSKWTLKEGWDNPNVFTICKLRSSGSEISKLQEVGRGLRLPVNEYMSRLEIGVDNFELDYIVDFTERDFASKLISEIVDTSITVREDKIIDELLEAKASKTGMQADDIFAMLLTEKIIDRTGVILNYERYDEEFKDFTNRNPKKGKIKTGDKKTKVSVRKASYDKFKELWEELNTKVMINYRIDSEETVENIVYEFIKNNSDKLSNDKLTYTKFKLNTNLVVNEKTTTEYLYKEEKIMYSDFLNLITRGCNVPHQTLHKVFIKLFNEDGIDINDYLNVKVARNIIRIVNQEIYNTIITNFSVDYKKLERNIHPTALTDENGELKEILSSTLGNKLQVGNAQEKYLYDEKYYDSDLELENIQEDIKEVVVFGKIPKSSIRIPMPNGTTYSPDFAYLVKGYNNKKILHLVVETKGYDSEKNISELELDRISLGTKFFEALNKSRSDIDIVFKKQLNSQKILDLIDESKSVTHYDD